MTKVEMLNDSAKLADVIKAHNELAAKHNELLEKFETRNGPKSERKMTDEDAKRIMLTDLKDKSHNECAELLNLSYGQIYSARKGFTFKVIYQEMLKAQTVKA